MLANSIEKDAHLLRYGIDQPSIRRSPRVPLALSLALIDQQYISNSSSKLGAKVERVLASPTLAMYTRVNRREAKCGQDLEQRHLRTCAKTQFLSLLR
jgi:hypothetical protein